MKPLSLLFVDDEDEFLATIEEFFDSLGYIVHTASNGQEALLQTKDHQPQAVFLDISMPHMDGTETLRLIREIDDNVHIIVVLGYASAPLARELLQQGAYDFFQKPVDLAQLQEAVERIQTIQDLA